MTLWAIGILGIATALALGAAALCLCLVWRRESTLHRAFGRALLVAFTTAAALFGGELCTYFLLIEPDGFNFTLASHRWFARHWHPVNSLGYRDREHTAASVEGRRVLFVLGDSVVAGHGTENARDRFSDVLGERLGDGWRVLNVARNGWSTGDELAALRGHPLTPDALVLSYFPNDVQGAAARQGHTWNFDLAPPAWARPVVERSHLADFAWWRLYRARFAREITADYVAFLDDAYRDPGVWAEHSHELGGIVDFAAERDTPLVAVLFPRLSAGGPAQSQPFLAQVAAALSARGVRSVDLTQHVEGLPVRDRVAGPFDAHPSVTLHHQVAALLHPVLAEELPRSVPALPAVAAPGSYDPPPSDRSS